MLPIIIDQFCIPKVVTDMNVGIGVHPKHWEITLQDYGGDCPEKYMLAVKLFLDLPMPSRNPYRSGAEAVWINSV